MNTHKKINSEVYLHKLEVVLEIPLIVAIEPLFEKFKHNT